MKTKPFFGEKGLTSTSANHYCNLAHEQTKRLQTYLSSVQFYSTELSLLGSSEKEVLSKGTTDITLIPKAIETIGQLHSLIAFFREAIKAKDDMSKEAMNWEDEVTRKEYNDRIKELDARRPLASPDWTEDDVIKSWSVGEQEKYLSLEAEASTLGQYIHDKGVLALARERLMSIINNPTEVTENGRDTLIKRFTPTCSQDEIDGMYFDLQAKHRKVQAELNGMKKRIEDEVKQHNLESDSIFRTAYESWKAEKNALEREFTTILNSENETRKKMLAEVQDLKIVVPNRLKEIFDALSAL